MISFVTKALVYNRVDFQITNITTFQVLLCYIKIGFQVFRGIEQKPKTTNWLAFLPQDSRVSDFLCLVTQEGRSSCGPHTEREPQPQTETSEMERLLE